MRTLVAVAVLVLCTGVLNAATIPECFARLEQETVVGDSLTVFTDDGVAVCGNHPILNYASSVLYMKLVTDSVPASDILIPFETIARISYRKPSSARHGLTVLGLGIGIAAGVIAGGAVAPESKTWFAGGETMCIGGVIGGIVGTIGGYEIGKHMTVKVTLICE